jgi:parallel beta-helix repeat protein
MRSLIRLSVVIVLALATGGQGASAQAVTVYVDPDITTPTCGNYSADARACGTGSATAYRTLSAAAAAAGPGTVVSIRGGTYREALSPARSGTEAAPIVFRRHGTETPTITGVDIGVTLVRREYVELDGLTVMDVNGWVRLQDSRHITIRNSTFRHTLARGTTGSIKVVRSSYNRILGNTLEEGNDSLVLVDASDRNLIEGNTFSGARHSLVSVRCSNFNVLRGNAFSNPWEKDVEVFDCEGVGSDNPVRFDAARGNLIELNEFTLTRPSGQDHDYNGIQHGAQQTIVRRNVFRNLPGGGVNFQEYPRESRYVYGNRMYHNTFYANHCHGIIGDLGTHQYKDMQVKNNLLYKNVGCRNESDQIRIPDRKAVVLTGNAIENADPGFVNEAGNDFHLAQGSRMIDAAGPLTETVAAGSGTSLAVKDVLYFYDGRGIPGEAGDTIQLIGGTDTAVVKAIDLKTNTLTLDRALTWSKGQGVALAYAGAAPDMGAFEFGLKPEARSPTPR